MSDYRSDCCGRYPDPSDTFRFSYYHKSLPDIDACRVCTPQVYKLCEKLKEHLDKLCYEYDIKFADDKKKYIKDNFDDSMLQEIEAMFNIEKMHK